MDVLQHFGWVQIVECAIIDAPVVTQALMAKLVPVLAKEKLVDDHDLRRVGSSGIESSGAGAEA